MLCAEDKKKTESKQSRYFCALFLSKRLQELCGFRKRTPWHLGKSEECRAADIRSRLNKVMRRDEDETYIRTVSMALRRVMMSKFTQESRGQEREREKKAIRKQRLLSAMTAYLT